VEKRGEKEKKKDTPKNHRFPNEKKMN